MWRIVLTLSIAAQVAEANPVTVVLSPGLRARKLTTDPGDENTKETAQSTLVGFDATLAIRVTPELAFGIHAGTSESLDYHNIYPFGYDPYTNLHIRPYDVGAAALYSYGRAWVAPWFGATISDINADGNA